MNFFCVGRLFLVWVLSLANAMVSHAVSISPGQVLWHYDSGYTNVTDFAVSKDGNVYLGYAETTGSSAPNEYGFHTAIALHTNQLIALDSVGNIKWQTADAGQYLAILPDGNIASSYSDITRRFTPYPTGGAYYGALSTNNYYIINQEDGSVQYFSSSGGRLAINADNSLLVVNKPRYSNLGSPVDIARVEGNLEPSDTWRININFNLGEAPVIASDGSFYVTTWGPGNPIYFPSGELIYSPLPPPILYAYKADGTLKWSLYDPTYQTGHNIPAIGSDGTLYTGSHQSVTNSAPDNLVTTENFYRFKAINNEGVTKWSIESSAPYSLAIVGFTNNVYVCTSTKLLALTSNGSELWTYDAGAPLNLSPALAADGTIYIATETGKLIALDGKTGVLKWEYNASKPIYNAPIIGVNGNIYLLVDRADMVVLAGSAEAAETAWPMERHDAQRTGRTTQASARGITVTEEGKLSLMLNVEPGKTYKVEASDDFQTWEEIGSFTSDSAAQTFLDETSVDKPQRFYRLVVE